MATILRQPIKKPLTAPIVAVPSVNPAMNQQPKNPPALQRSWETKQTAVPKGIAAGGAPIAPKDLNVPGTPTQNTSQQAPEKSIFSTESDVYNNPIFDKNSEAYSLANSQYKDPAAFAKELGLNAGPESIEDVVKKYKESNQKASDFQKQINSLETGIEEDSFKMEQAKGRSAINATQANFAQSREGVVGSSQFKVAEGFSKRVGEQMDLQSRAIEVNKLKRKNAEEQLADAQARGDETLAKSIMGDIAAANQSIREAEAQLGQVQNEAMDMSIKMQAQVNQKEQFNATLKNSQKEFDTTLANENRKFDKNLQSQARSEAFDYLDSLPAGSLEGMDIQQLSVTLGVDVQTAGILSQLDKQKASLQLSDPDYMTKMANLEVVKKEAKWAGMTESQKNFEYYKEMLSHSPELAEKFAMQTGISERPEVVEYNDKILKDAERSQEIYGATGVWVSANGKFKGVVSNGGISFDESAPAGTYFGQCGKFANQVLGTPSLFVDSFQDKLSVCNSDAPIAGGAFVEYIAGSQYGHVGIVERVFEDGSFSIRDANYSSPPDGVIRTSTIHPGDSRYNRIAEQGGFYDPSVGGKTAGELIPGADGESYDMSTPEGKAMAIFDGSAGLNLKDIPIKDRAAVAAALNTMKNDAQKNGDIEGMIRASVGGKELDQTQMSQFAKTASVIQQLGSLDAALNNKDTLKAAGIDPNPFTGWLKSKFPWSEEGQEVTATLTATIPNLARGVYGEVGVLTDADVELYRKTLPNLSQPEDIRKSITAMTLRSLKNSMENQLKSAASFGRDVSGALSYYQELSAQVTEIESSLGINPDGTSSIEPSNSTGQKAIPNQTKSEKMGGGLANLLVPGKNNSPGSNKQSSGQWQQGQKKQNKNTSYSSLLAPSAPPSGYEWMNDL